ncbi:MAG: hypothetical protein J6B59_05420 [Alistipes sp.]|nr:hypothetical protein [Alistipes sp.]MBQ3083289.1 hypothetical protein [Alistipes sp.]MBQ7297227.1 hypothetical protein [Alistipes sp.]
MEDTDHDKLHDAISEDEELLMNEVIQGESDLYYLHHYLSELLRPGDI